MTEFSSPCRISSLVLILFFSTQGFSAVDRVVVLKADGLAFDSLDYFVRTIDPKTGKSVLPWIDHIFYQHGTRVSNFYSRGLSLSAPSWALLDTGQPSVIKGNLEFDRLTLQSYDYLNVFSHVLQRAAGAESMTMGARVIDEQGLRLLSDSYLPSERYVSPQLFVRRLPTGLSSVRRLLTLQNPKEWFDEWTMGFETDSIMFEVLERELIARLKDPAIRYLDFMIPVFDHVVHVNREPEAMRRAVEQIDEVVGRVWSAVEKTSAAKGTVLILVSDHGINTDSRIYSQGYNLVELFTSARGGGHHVVTNHPPLGEYGFKSLSPTVPMVTTASPDSRYLKGLSAQYPTLLLDADGNERASVYLRNSELNVLHILWQQLARKDLKVQFRAAALNAFFAVIERNRRQWTSLAVELQAELSAIARTRNKRQPAKDESAYLAYVTTLNRLLALRPQDFDAHRLKISDVLPERSVGPANSIYHLQNYVVGLSDQGLVLNKDGALDWDRTFVRIHYPSLLQQIRTLNNVQPSVASQPVDFIAAAIPGTSLQDALPGEVGRIDDAVWLSSDDESQALILSRRDSEGRLFLRYLPVRNLKQSADGTTHFSLSPWRDRLPLCLWEDLPLPENERRTWLASWHEESEWLAAIHLTRYSNGVISLYEQFTTFEANTKSEVVSDELVVSAFRSRKRSLTRADFVVFASDHWNFNYRGFNPGGNHGGFFRKSTHATLMFAGGAETNIPEGVSIDRPYDVLSFAPTFFKLVGENDTKNLSSHLVAIGFRSFPGPVIEELFPKR